jgi:hypothetical protein
LIFPIPSGATGVSGLGIVGGGEDASSVLEVVSSVASQAVSSFGIPGVAVGAHWFADAFGIEERTISARFTSLGSPYLAEGIGGGNERGRVDDAGSVSIENVAAVARKTGSRLIPCVAEVGNGSADLGGIEEESYGALEAVVVAVPGEAARVHLFISSDDSACSIEQGVAFVTLLADTYGLVEVAALRGNLTASTFRVEEVALGTGHTDIDVPLGTAEVVVEGSQ